MEHWDVVVVGGGPAGAACAAAARRAAPAARVLVLDRADFPRDKVCGDGIAPEALDVLAGLGIDPAALTAGYAAVAAAAAALPRRRDGRAGDAPAGVRRPPGGARRPTAHGGAGHRRGVPPAHRPPARRPPDARRGRRRAHAPACWSGRTARSPSSAGALGIAPNRADRLGDRDPRLRPEPARARTASRSILTTEQRWPAYAWSFPLGDGRANVGYGELVSGGSPAAGCSPGWPRCCPASSRSALKAHRLPLSTGRPRQPDGRVLLAGDAASLINPLTGEGIFYAVLSGALAGAAAVRGGDAGAAYRRALQRRLGRHLRHSSTASWASRWPRLMDAVFRAADDDQRVFDDVVALGLADGRLTARTLAAAARRLR